MCKNQGYHYYFDSFGRHNSQFNCGKCMECLSEYQNNWKVRMIHEADYHNTCLFVTLTYNESSVPYKPMYVDELTGDLSLDYRPGYTAIVPHDGRAVQRRGDKYVDGRDGYCRSVSKRDIQNWLKASRMRYLRDTGVPLAFKYFCTSEYGPHWLRPHYHFVFFGLTKSVFDKYFNKDWTTNYGFSDVEEIVTDVANHKSKGAVMNYVSKYCNKGAFENPRVKEGTVEKTFHLSSKGIGKRWVLEHLDYFAPFLSPDHLTKRKFEYCQRSKIITNEKTNEFSVRRFLEPYGIKNESGKTIIRYRSYHVPHVVRRVKTSVLRDISRRYQVVFSSPTKDYPYKLPRYYSNYIQAYSPNLYHQVRDYQRTFALKRDEIFINNLSVSLGVSYAEAEFEYNLRKKAYHVNHCDLIYRNLRKTYNRCQIQ